MRPSYTINFPPSVRLAMWGQSNYSAVTGDYLTGVAVAEDFFNSPVNVLRVGFKNFEFVNFGALRPPDEHIVVGQRGSIRVQRVADVAFMPIDPANPQPVVMAMLNADCPGIFAVDHNEEGQAIGCWFAHAGLDCLLPEELSSHTVLETIRYQRRMLGLRGNIDFYFGGGIGPCCYGLEHLAQVRTRFLRRFRPQDFTQKFLSSATTGPRQGQASIELGRIFKEEVSDTFSRTCNVSVSIDNHCTACAGTSNGQGKRLLWSHVYDGGPDKTPLNPRNFMCFAWTPERKRR